MTNPTSSAAGISWNLNDLYQSISAPQLITDMERAKELAQTFAGKYRNKINVPGGSSAAFLAEAMRDLETLSELLDKPLIYAHLVHAAKTDDPKHGALMSK